MHGTTAEPVLKSAEASGAAGRRLVFPWPFWAALVLLVACFALPLFNLTRFSLRDHFYSHIILIPFICGYLLWTDRKLLPEPVRGPIGPALVPAIAALAVLGLYFGVFRGPMPRPDRLFWTILPFCLFLTSLVLFFCGTRFARAAAFPLAFFYFITPFPDAFTNALEIASQKGSAEVFAVMISMTGIPFLRDGQTFLLPGLPLVIAQECSGIRSSFVLFLTSLLAGHMFLRTRWKSAFLAFFVIPLGLLRNGFRVLVLAVLTIYWDPQVIHGPIHHRGGPIFFALSLIPFFLFLLWLRKTERVSTEPSNKSLQ